MKSFNSIDEIRDWLIPLGFHEYKPTDIHHESIVTCFQKRYDDDFGKKYFLDINVWDYTLFPAIPERYHPSITGQFYQAETHDAVNFDFIDWDIDAAEKWIDKMFEVGLLEHYERWD